MKTHLFALCLCFPFLCICQNDIELLIRELRFEEARTSAVKSLERLNPGSDEYSKVLYHLGVCQMNLAELDAAKQTFSSGLSLPQVASYPLFWKGLAMLQHENLNYDSALFFYEKALAATDSSDPLYIQLLIDKGDMLMAKEQYKDASKLFYQAKQLFDRTEAGSSYLQHLVHSYIGEYFLIKNDYKNAEINLKLALNIADEIFNPDHPRMSELHEALGLTYTYLENKESMLYHYERVYEINRKDKRKGSYDLIVANNIMGMSLLNAKYYEEASKYLYIAYNDIATFFPTFDLGIHIVGMNLGITYYKLKEYELAVAYLDTSISAGRKAYGAKAQTLGEALGYLAQTYEDKGDLKMALQKYSEAIASNSLLKAGEQLSEHSEAVDVLTLSFALGNRALYYEKRYVNEGDPALLQLAKEDADLNLKILQKHQESLPLESRSSLSFELNFAYFLVADINVLLYQISPETPYAENILNSIERSKSDYLRASLALADAKANANIPEQILALEDELQIKKEAIRASIISGENAGERSLPWDSLALVQQKIDSVRLISSSYLDGLYQYAQKSISEIQNQLQTERAILDFMHQEGILIQVILTEDQLIIARDSATSLQEEVLSFRHEIQSLAADFSTQNSLSDLLLGKINELPASINKLTIIPDGVLHYLPFDLLRSGDKYLLERYDVGYANFINNARTDVERNDRLLSFAPNFGADKLASLDVVRSDLAAIPGAFNEVESINSLFRGESITNTMATETVFKEKAESFGLIHMATHAIVDDSNPEMSRLVFNLSQDSINDGYLHAYEIFNLNLKAKLVTLSACNTGYGKIERGEGVMSLSWAFAYAGVPSTVVSLWPASDKSTPELMKYFYQNLKDGQPKDLALNNARKSYLATATGKARHPFYWGGFVLIGDTEPIQDDTNLLVYLIPSMLIIVMILTLYRRKRQAS